MEISNALDAENTEQDVSAAGESLENLAENEAGAGGDNNLEDIMDQHSQVVEILYTVLTCSSVLNFNFQLLKGFGGSVDCGFGESVSNGNG